MKAAVYSGEKIYFLIEDDQFPEKLPGIIETINVSNQQFFPKRGANFRTSFSYMKRVEHLNEARKLA